MSTKQPDYDPTNIQSKKKLDVYIGYLRIYLNILLRAFPKEIHIYDMLAGRGKYGESKSPGSAIQARDVIEKLLSELSNKKVYLHLNEYDIEIYNELCINIGDPKPDWVDCTNEDVNHAIQLCLDKDSDNNHEIFYLDPFGYTQIEKASIDKIMGRRHAECLLFVPVSNIARFYKRGQPVKEQIEGVARFLEEYEIDTQEIDAQKIEWDDWRRFIKDKLAEIYSKQYVGMATLQTDSANNYALYFIGNHIYGLDKFVEVVSKIEKDEDVQLTLFSEADEKFESDLCEYLSESRTNIDLYIWGLEQGWSPSRTNKVLARLDKVGNLDVSSTINRKRGIFYLSYKYHRMISPVLSVKIKSEGRLWG